MTRRLDAVQLPGRPKQVCRLSRYAQMILRDGAIEDGIEISLRTDIAQGGLAVHRGSSSRVVKLRDTSSADRIGKLTAAWPMLAVKVVGRCRVTGVFFENRRSTPWR